MAVGVACIGKRGYIRPEGGAGDTVNLPAVTLPDGIECYVGDMGVPTPLPTSFPPPRNDITPPQPLGQRADRQAHPGNKKPGVRAGLCRPERRVDLHVGKVSPIGTAGRFSQRERGRLAGGSIRATTLPALAAGLGGGLRGGVYSLGSGGSFFALARASSRLSNAVSLGNASA